MWRCNKKDIYDVLALILIKAKTLIKQWENKKDGLESSK
jgi:hypothetical protein